MRVQRRIAFSGYLFGGVRRGCELLRPVPLATPVDTCLKNSFIQPHDLLIVL